MNSPTAILRSNEQYLYRLYANGVAVHDIPASYTSSDFIIDTEEINISFTLMAVFSDNTETPHSTPYQFTLTYSVPSPVQGFRVGSYLEKNRMLRLILSTITGPDLYQIRAYGKELLITDSFLSEALPYTCVLFGPHLFDFVTTTSFPSSVVIITIHTTKAIHNI